MISWGRVIIANSGACLTLCTRKYITSNAFFSIVPKSCVLSFFFGIFIDATERRRSEGDQGVVHYLVVGCHPIHLLPPRVECGCISRWRPITPYLLKECAGWRLPFLFTFIKGLEERMLFHFLKTKRLKRVGFVRSIVFNGLNYMPNYMTFEQMSKQNRLLSITCSKILMNLKFS